MMEFYPRVYLCEQQGRFDRENQYVDIGASGTLNLGAAVAQEVGQVIY